MNCTARDLLLYAVTDRHWLGAETLSQQVEKALRGGATFVQLREKTLDHDAFLSEAREIKSLCAKFHVPFVINDDVDVALAVDADGVHVGQADMEAGDVRKKLGPNKIIGVSCKTVEQALTAQAHGADYLGVGAMFPTDTKADASAVTFDALRAVCSAVSIPVVAIGGIKEDNVERLTGTGIAGVAVVSAIFAQTDIEGATRSLKTVMTRLVK
jgi:thiamine-phosphate pyrophosphorylase